MMIYVLSVLISFALALLLGRLLIPVLRRLKLGQSIREDGPTWHMSKQGTPTMGGLIFIVPVIFVCLSLGWNSNLSGGFSGFFVLAMALIFGAVGFADDYVKVKKKQNLGLTAWQKFALQLVVALAFIALMRAFDNLSYSLYVPFLDLSFELPAAVYTVFAAFVIVGTVNSVNLTDGVDGLAGGVTLPVCAFFTMAALRLEMGALGIFASSLIGGLFGFLVYNFHPAKVFMGDTGSLFLGGAVCGMAFAMDMPLILIPVGIVYIAEALSDIIQVAYFKISHGKRVFRMAPLHHHFEKGGWSEIKVFWVFSGVSALFCIIAYLGII